MATYSLRRDHRWAAHGRKHRSWIRTGGYRAAGWQLSPAYDLNPTPTDIKSRYLSLAVDEVDTAASLPLALEVAPQFGLKPEEARAIAAEVGRAVSIWRDRAAVLGLTAKEIARMESAFEHDDLKLALK